MSEKRISRHRAIRLTGAHKYKDLLSGIAGILEELRTTKVQTVSAEFVHEPKR